MVNLDPERFQRSLLEYLSKLYKTPVRLLYLGPINKEAASSEGLKEFGYGKTLLVEFEVKGGVKSLVLSSMTENIFGHQHFSDRAQALLLAHSCFNKLPKHVKSVDVGVFTSKGGMISLGDAEEFFIVTEKVEGKLYYLDLERVKSTGVLTKLDEDRATVLADYLASIHKVKGGDPSLYVRRIRDLIGHGECLMGLTDSYPPNLDFTTPEELKEIEKKCVEYRYKIKFKTSRLCQVHGDFHPWNILFREGVDFTVIDRSRGEWGEAADDLASITINYLFYALQATGKVEGPFLKLFNLFWSRYLEATGDEEILTVIAPFYAWRGLVVASPIWYPRLENKIRRKIFTFIHNILECDKLSLREVPLMFEEM
ncbi:MAG: aminoglycoside phosphotransferase family protein [Candidatus Odinarchaeum yellowstonii]|uniref:Aminoglycoside phosphotransferase family protein n=1 Tax=Odinarchaeota yellowstonii (strain LCB_4) TaxID=1841599 RepID=A0AAF0IBB8_ODILC|nr:MAG: aminoglycoside phosphotransferase family protein [Candidatus Odinarchaeum yellowstonii]